MHGFNSHFLVAPDVAAVLKPMLAKRIGSFMDTRKIEGCVGISLLLRGSKRTNMDQASSNKVKLTLFQLVR